MLFQCDVKGLEMVCAAYLSQDLVMMQELTEGVDIHEMNRVALGLPNRGVAKVMAFRTIYGGGAYSFSIDPDFAEVGYKEKQWQEVIDAYYKKYTGLAEWHKNIVLEVVETGKLVVPCTGRVYEYEAIHGKYAEPSIKNYPVQGLGADIVALARVSLFNRLKRLGWESCLLVNTVHDSLIIDYDEKVCYTDNLNKLVLEVFKDLPANFEKLFKTKFNLEVNVVNMVGEHWNSLEEI